MDRIDFGRRTDRETEASIGVWLDRTFPRSPNAEDEIQTCVAAILEEAVETAVAAGMSRARVMEIASVTYTKSLDDFNCPDEVAGEAADVHLTLVSLCRAMDTTLDDAVQRRMKRNRSRTQSYYDEKRAKKQKIGLR